MKLFGELKKVRKANDGEKTTRQIPELHLFDCKNCIQIGIIGGEKTKWESIKKPKEQPKAQ